MIRYSRSASFGFTLMEIIISIAIFAIIAAITFPALIQFLDIRERINKKNAALSDMQKVFLFFNRDVTFAVNRLGKDEFGESADAPLLVGGDSLIELTTSYQDFELDGAAIPRKVKWIYEDGSLIRVQYPVLDPDGDTRVYRQRLLENVEEVEITAYSVDEGRESESNRWDDEERLPNMLRLVIELDNGITYERYATMLSGDKGQALSQTEPQQSIPVSSQSISTGSGSTRGGGG